MAAAQNARLAWKQAGGWSTKMAPICSAFKTHHDRAPRGLSVTSVCARHETGKRTLLLDLTQIRRLHSWLVVRLDSTT